jgi:membrane protein
LFAVVSIAGLVLDPATVKDQVNDNLSGLPEEARTIIGDQLESVSGGSTGGLIAGLVVGLVLALWTSSGAMAKLLGALNTIYDTTETRNFLKLRGTALGLTFGGIIFISSAIFLLAALPPLLESVDAIGDSAATLFVWIRFPVLGLVMIVALGVLYHVGPDRNTNYRPITSGAAAAMALWIGLSALFTIYTSTVGSYNETYGSIGGIVVLLLWLFITAFVVLLGAEIHAQTKTDASRPAES